MAVSVVTGWGCHQFARAWPSLAYYIVMVYQNDFLSPYSFNMVNQILLESGYYEMSNLGYPNSNLSVSTNGTQGKLELPFLNLYC